jgi:hypothetical protein
MACQPSPSRRLSPRRSNSLRKPVRSAGLLATHTAGRLPRPERTELYAEGLVALRADCDHALLVRAAGSGWRNFADPQRSLGMFATPQLSRTVIQLLRCEVRPRHSSISIVNNTRFIRGVAPTRPPQTQSYLYGKLKVVARHGGGRLALAHHRASERTVAARLESRAMQSRLGPVTA